MRKSLRKADPHTNIDYYAPNNAPDNDRKMKESSFLASQAFIESLRTYPQDEFHYAPESPKPDGVVHYAGNTLTRAHWHGEGAEAGRAGHVPPSSSEHIESDVRMRLGIAPAKDGWNVWCALAAAALWSPRIVPALHTRRHACTG